MALITGGCLCGRVRYESSGEALFGVVCHCRDCQRASGTGHVPVIGIRKSTFSLTGETRSHAVVGGSGRLAVRHFCPNCGSMLFGAPEIAPHIVTLYVGSLDEPDAFRAQHAQFVRDRPDWSRLALRIAEYESAGVVSLERL
jgi:hypothetical protein